MFEDLQGQIERITFHNEENGFTIARLKVKGFRELVTVVGNLMALKGSNLLLTHLWGPGIVWPCRGLYALNILRHGIMS
jgi:hypothetical protein